MAGEPPNEGPAPRPRRRAAPRAIALLVLLVLVIGGVLAAVLLDRHSGSPGSVPAGAIAVVGTRTVSRSEFTALMRQRQIQYRQQKRSFPDPGTRAYNEIRDRITAYLVNDAEFREQAAELGVTVSAAEVEDALAKFKRTTYGGDHARYDAALEAQGLTETGAFRGLELQMIASRLFAKVLADTPKAQRNGVMNTWTAALQQSYCAGRIRYAPAYVPLVDPCKTVFNVTTG